MSIRVRRAITLDLSLHRYSVTPLLHPPSSATQGAAAGTLLPETDLLAILAIDPCYFNRPRVKVQFCSCQTDMAKFWKTAQEISNGNFGIERGVRAKNQASYNIRWKCK